jgi:hypothetical protein
VDIACTKGRSVGRGLDLFKLAAIPLFLVVAASTIAQTNSGPASSGKGDASRRPSTKSLAIHEIKIVDEAGHTRITLSAVNGTPAIRFLDSRGSEKLSILLDQSGLSSVKLKNPNAAGPVAALEIDDKGAHVKFDRPGGASSYLFLNNSGESGVVFLDASGARIADIVVTPAGTSEIHRYDRQPSFVP